MLVLSMNLFKYDVISKDLRTITFYNPAFNATKFENKPANCYNRIMEIIRQAVSSDTILISI